MSVLRFPLFIRLQSRRIRAPEVHHRLVLLGGLAPHRDHLNVSPVFVVLKQRKVVRQGINGPKMVDQGDQHRIPLLVGEPKGKLPLPFPGDLQGNGTVKLGHDPKRRQQGIKARQVVQRLLLTLGIERLDGNGFIGKAIVIVARFSFNFGESFPTP